MGVYTEHSPLIGSELEALYAIATQMRKLTAGMPRAAARVPIATELAKRAGVAPSTSLRALLALPDLRRPRPTTFEVVATGVGRPDLAAAWEAHWKAAR